MRPHLPLSLRKALLKSLERTLHSTLGSGSLLLAALFSMSGAAAVAETPSQPALTFQGDVLQEDVCLTFDASLTLDHEAAAEDEAEAGGTSADEDEAEEEALDDELQEDEAEKTIRYSPEFIYALVEPIRVDARYGKKGWGDDSWSDWKNTRFFPRLVVVYPVPTPYIVNDVSLPEFRNERKRKAAAQAQEEEAKKKAALAAAAALTTTGQKTQAGGGKAAGSVQSNTQVQALTVPGTDTSGTGGFGAAMPVMLMSSASPAMLVATATSNATASALAATEGLVWTGSSSGYWDSSSRNWKEDGATTTFADGDSVTFDDTGRNRDINVSSAKSVTNMTISASDYHFSGGGNISIDGTLDVHVADKVGYSYDMPARISFGSANNITAGTILLRSGINTRTTFGASVTADTLSIENCLAHGNKAGEYVFEGAVAVSGAFSANLGTEEGDTGAAGKTLLTVGGALSAASVTLDGTGAKHFYGSVTSAGDLTVSSQLHSSARDGIATFETDVIIGGTLTIDGHSEAVFHQKILTAADSGDASNLQVVLDDGQLRFDCFTTYLGGTNTYSLGTIALRGDKDGISLGSLTLADADVVGSDATNGNDFAVNGEAKRLSLQLTNIRDFEVNGGAVFVEAASSGQIKGNFTLSHGATVTLLGDNVFAGNINGALTVSGAGLQLGSTTQTIYADMALVDGGRIYGETGGTGGLVVAGDWTLRYTGTNNSVNGGMQLGSNTFTVEAVPETEDSHQQNTTLSLAGSLLGTGNLVFSGMGETRIETDLGYAGAVRVEDGSVLVLDHHAALEEASGVTVGDGAGLSIVHNGLSTQLNGANGLYLEDGARINFTNLSGHGGSAAITLGNGKLLFGGDVIISFDETAKDANGDPVKLENLHTYTLVASAAGIDQAPGTTAGSVTVYANGKDTPLAADQYEFGYMNASGIRYFTFTMLAGKSWKGGAGGDWHAQEADSYTNWTEGAVGEVALFRDQGADIPTVRIGFSKPSAASGLYMDGSTDYTIAVSEGFADSFAPGEEKFAFKTPSDLIKKGDSTMTWEGLPLNLRNADIGEGTVALTGGSTLVVSGMVTISPASYNSSGTVVDTAKLSIDSSSVLKQGAATLSGYNGGTAELHGVTIADGTISAQNSGISGVTTRHTISNARFGIDSALADETKEGSNGFVLNNLELTGEGEISHTTLGEGVSISGQYSLGNAVTVTHTVTNSGTIAVDAASTVIGIGRMESSGGTYTVFSGGDYSGWSSLGAENFRIHGTLVSDINGAEVNTRTGGRVTIDAGNAVIFEWDAAWGIDSWEAPTAGYAYSNTGRNTLNVVATSGSSLNSNYRYSSVVNGGSDRVYTVNINDGAGYNGSRYYLYGIASNASRYTSEASPVDIWIRDEGSHYRTLIAGANSGTYYGDTHLQITGALDYATTIIGASQNATQHGDSCLTIEAGSYSGDTIAAGSSGAVHYGNSLLHIKGGTYGTVYGGTYNSYTSGGDTRVIVDGGTISTIYGGDYSTSSNTHAGNVVIDLQGGTLTNVYGAGGGSNQNSVTGTVAVNLCASGGSMLPAFASSARLDGGADVTSGSSTLGFRNAGTYDLRNVTIEQFDRFELAEGAAVQVDASRFNVTNDLTISGPGDVTVTGSSDTKHEVWLEQGATLNIRTSFFYTGYSENPQNFPHIHVAKGSTLDVTGFPRDNDGGGSLSLHLYLAGDGADGLGAFYKGSSADDAAQGGRSKVGIAYITLTDNASIGGVADSSSSFFMIPSGNTSHAAVLDLRNDDSAQRGYVFTKQGENTFGLFNVDVKGGTINVVSGTLSSSYNSAAGNSDLVLHEGTTLELADDAVGNRPGTGEDSGTAAVKADFNGLGVESLTGGGTIELGKHNYLYIDMNLGYTDFSPEFGATPQEGQLFYNSKGYEYAHFSGMISDDPTEGAGTVAKGGAGTQYFTGSESDYHGKTSVEGGILYLTGTSTATTFAKGSTEVSKGVVGVSSLSWEGGKVWLGDGVRIYNSGECLAEVEVLGSLVAPDMAIGVDAVVQEDGSLYYHEATYSGVLTSAGGMVKEGLGTLNVDQQGSFEGGTTIAGGTLNIYGWGSANDAVLTQASGTSLMFSYDGTYEGEAAHELIGADTRFEVVGRGDERWVDDTVRTGNDPVTAALISDIAAAKTLEIQGMIMDKAGAESGNLLHSGEGTLILAGENTYGGGTTVTNGVVVVANNTGLGATALGGAANLVTQADARVEIVDGVETSLAAVKDGTHAGNEIRGTVTIGSGAEGAAAARLNMTGDGYYAARTELESNATLVFCGEDSTNWKEGDARLSGAGALAGGGTVVVSDAEGKGTSAYFQVTDSLAASDTGFVGDMVVEGDNTLLHIQGGQLSGGSYDISGNGARIDAKRSTITVQDGKHIALRSMGDADADKYSTAVLAAHMVEVEKGGTLSAYQEKTSYQYNAAGLEEASQLDLTTAMMSYYSPQGYDYHYDSGEDRGYEYEQFFVNTASVNNQTTATLETDGGLTMRGGSIYDVYDTNISLAGTQLTFDVTDSEKIILRGGSVFQAYIDGLVAAVNSEDPSALETQQWVLFSDVKSFDAIMNSQTLLHGEAVGGYARKNQIYVGQASNYVHADYGDGTQPLPADILLVYDAGAEVLYLDRKPNIYPEPTYEPAPVPEPASSTLTLLALAGLAARRRRK